MIEPGRIIVEPHPVGAAVRLPRRGGFHLLRRMRTVFPRLRPGDEFDVVIVPGARALTRVWAWRARIEDEIRDSWLVEQRRLAREAADREWDEAAHG